MRTEYSSRPWYKCPVLYLMLALVWSSNKPANTRHDQYIEHSTVQSISDYAIDVFLQDSYIQLSPSTQIYVVPLVRTVECLSLAVQNDVCAWVWHQKPGFTFIAASGKFLYLTFKEVPMTIICDIKNCLEASPGSVFNSHKYDVETWSLQCTSHHTQGGLSEGRDKLLTRHVLA